MSGIVRERDIKRIIYGAMKPAEMQNSQGGPSGWEGVGAGA